MSHKVGVSSVSANAVIGRGVHWCALEDCGKPKNKSDDLDLRLDNERKLHDMREKGKQVVMQREDQGTMEEGAANLLARFHNLHWQRHHHTEASTSQACGNAKLVPIKHREEEYFSGTRQPKRNRLPKPTKKKEVVHLEEVSRPSKPILPAGYQPSNPTTNAWTVRKGTDLFDHCKLSLTIHGPDDDELLQRALEESLVTLREEQDRIVNMYSGSCPNLEEKKKPWKPLPNEVLDSWSESPTPSTGAGDGAWMQSNNNSLQSSTAKKQFADAVEDGNREKKSHIGANLPENSVYDGRSRSMQNRLQKFKSMNDTENNSLAREKCGEKKTAEDLQRSNSDNYGTSRCLSESKPVRLDAGDGFYNPTQENAFSKTNSQESSQRNDLDNRLESLGFGKTRCGSQKRSILKGQDLNKQLINNARKSASVQDDVRRKDTSECRVDDSGNQQKRNRHISFSEPLTQTASRKERSTTNPPSPELNDPDPWRESGVEPIYPPQAVAARISLEEPATRSNPVPEFHSSFPPKSRQDRVPAISGTQNHRPQLGSRGIARQATNDSNYKTNWNSAQEKEKLSVEEVPQKIAAKPQRQEEHSETKSVMKLRPANANSLGKQMSEKWIQETPQRKSPVLKDSSQVKETSADFSNESPKASVKDESEEIKKMREQIQLLDSKLRSLSSALEESGAHNSSSGSEADSKTQSSQILALTNDEERGQVTAVESDSQTLQAKTKAQALSQQSHLRTLLAQALAQQSQLRVHQAQAQVQALTQQSHPQTQQVQAHTQQVQAQTQQVQVHTQQVQAQTQQVQAQTQQVQVQSHSIAQTPAIIHSQTYNQSYASIQAPAPIVAQKQTSVETPIPAYSHPEAQVEEGVPPCAQVENVADLSTLVHIPAHPYDSVPKVAPGLPVPVPAIQHRALSYAEIHNGVKVVNFPAQVLPERNIVTPGDAAQPPAVAMESNAQGQFSPSVNDEHSQVQGLASSQRKIQVCGSNTPPLSLPASNEHAYLYSPQALSYSPSESLHQQPHAFPVAQMHHALAHARAHAGAQAHAFMQAQVDTQAQVEAAHSFGQNQPQMVPPGFDLNGNEAGKHDEEIQEKIASDLQVLRLSYAHYNAELHGNHAHALALFHAQAQAHSIAQAQAEAEVRTEAQTHADAVAHAKACAEALAHSQSEAPAHFPTYGEVPAHSLAQAYAQAHAHAHSTAYAHVLAQTHAQAQAQAEAVARVQSHAPASVHIPATSTHVPAHTQASSQFQAHDSGRPGIQACADERDCVLNITHNPGQSSRKSLSPEIHSKTSANGYAQVHVPVHTEVSVDSADWKQTPIHPVYCQSSQAQESSFCPDRKDLQTHIPSQAEIEAQVQTQVPSTLGGDPSSMSAYIAMHQQQQMAQQHLAQQQQLMMQGAAAAAAAACPQAFSAHPMALNWLPHPGATPMQAVGARPEWMTQMGMTNPGAMVMPGANPNVNPVSPQDASSVSQANIPGGVPVSSPGVNVAQQNLPGGVTPNMMVPTPQGMAAQAQWMAQYSVWQQQEQQRLAQFMAQRMPQMPGLAMTPQMAVAMQQPMGWTNTGAAPLQYEGDWVVSPSDLARLEQGLPPPEDDVKEGEGSGNSNGSSPDLINTQSRGLHLTNGNNNMQDAAYPDPALSPTGSVRALGLPLPSALKPARPPAHLAGLKGQGSKTKNPPLDLSAFNPNLPPPEVPKGVKQRSNAQLDEPRGRGRLR